MTTRDVKPYIRRIIAISVLSLIVAIALFAATISLKYPVSGGTSLTVTALNSLANSTSQTTGIWESAFVDNTSNGYLDDALMVTVTSGSSGVSSTGQVTIYLYGCISNTTTCTDGVSGSQGTTSLTLPTNLFKVASCNVVANSTAYNCGPYSVSNNFGGVVFARWGVVLQNLTGAPLAASGNAVVYDPIAGQSQ